MVAIWVLTVDMNTGVIVPTPQQPTLTIVNQQLNKYQCKIHFLWVHWQVDLTDKLKEKIDQGILSPAVTRAMQKAFEDGHYSEGPLYNQDGDLVTRTNPGTLRTQRETGMFIHAWSQMSILSTGAIYHDNMPDRYAQCATFFIELF